MSLAALSALACGDDGKVLGERSHSGGAGGSGGSGNRAGASTTGGDTARGGSSPTGGASGASAGGTMATGGSAGTGDASGGDAGASAGDAGASGSAAGGSANGGDAGAGGGSGAAAGSGAGGGSGSGGGTGTPCVDRTCSDSEACVAHRTIGGAVTSPDDAGACPPNQHEENDYCLVNYVYQCVAQPGCTGGTVDCSCGTCPQPFNTCRALYMAGWLDTDAKLVCEQLAP